MKNLRFVSAQILEKVIQGQSLSDVLEKSLLSLKDARDKAFVQAICYGVCRFYNRLDITLESLLEKPFREKDCDVYALLLVGLYQLQSMRIPDYAAVTETVNATELLKKSWARGLVNAVLRNYLRHHQEIAAMLENELEAKYAHPEWWIKAIKNAWPQDWQAILDANNEHPPFSLRVNQQKISRDSYIELLTQNQMTANIIPETMSGICLETPIIAEELPKFSQGYVSVQDGAAQLAAELLQLSPQLHVLDACAAPGGKLTHILEIQPEISVLALEKNPQRVKSIKANLQRLNMQAQCITGDANDVYEWWDNALFDRILLDAPCSASGVVRRHPDIKLLRQPTDIPAFADQQIQLLESLWPLLKVGGLLLYSTCSIFPQENTDVMAEFLSLHNDALSENLDVPWGRACEFGRQILPGENNMDGFYYALIRKI